ncbi:hypothetical protein G2W53_001580 [Senna tora]|uniref:GRF-type domain-containing protein n=2 Tax=Senna tora TaxID=362788 RepID=A0A834XFT7_9FABA|nr:hypothetical protein G2W53_001580 [Senna tora]
MASQTSSSSSSRARVLCDCGEYAIVATSRTPENPGRRFWGCKNYPSAGNCGFVGWYEPPVQNDDIVVYRLRRKIVNLEAQLEDKKKRNEEDLKKIESLQRKNYCPMDGWAVMVEWTVVLLNVGAALLSLLFDALEFLAHMVDATNSMSTRNIGEHPLAATTISRR